MVEVVGVYPVVAPEPCHLVELIVRPSEGSFDFGEFTQGVPMQPRSEWQVPYGEKLLDPSGDRVEWDPWDERGDEMLWRGDIRVVFFFHYLDLDSPMSTPFGEVALPGPGVRPDRLSTIVYEVS